MSLYCFFISKVISVRCWLGFEQCEHCMGYYAKLLLVCRLRLCNPLIVFEVDSCIVLKFWTFHCKTLSLIVPSKRIRNEMLSW
jgi:hypothetical protein